MVMRKQQNRYTIHTTMAIAVIAVAALLSVPTPISAFAPSSSARPTFLKTSSLQRQRYEGQQQQQLVQRQQQGTSPSKLQALPTDTVLGLANSLVIATIDSDIANISDDQFGLVFAGGIAVMIGGLISTIFVGMMVDSKDLYTNIVADSYLQGSDDEEFWKGLSEEEKIKTQELLSKIQQSKDSGKDLPPPPVEIEAERAAEQIVTSSTSNKSSSSQTEIVTNDPVRKEIGMFSDYADE